MDIGSNEISLKVVNCGPALSGRTTNLHYVWVRTYPGKEAMKFYDEVPMVSGIRAFDFVPSSLAPLNGKRVRVLLAASTTANWDGSRHEVLSGVDGVVFVADVQKERAQANQESMQALARSLTSFGHAIEEIPLVLQYNKCDLSNRMTLADLQETLNPQGVPHFEATAQTGVGVFDSLKAIVHLLVAREAERQGVPYR